MDLPFSTIVAPLLEALRPTVTVDVGGDDGCLSERVADFVAAWDGEVQTVFDKFDELSGVELVLLHGDANWWTVHGQLEALAAAALRTTGALPVFVVGGVDEPTRRRDRYAEPERIPAEGRQPYKKVDSHWQALDHSTPHNGVLTAVDDFLADHEGVCAVAVPGMGGVAIVYSTAHTESGSLAFSELLRELDLAPAARAHADALARQVREQSNLIESTSTRVAELEADRERDVPFALEAQQLRRRTQELAERLSIERGRTIEAELRVADSRRALRSGSASRIVAGTSRAGSSPEPRPSDVRDLLRPAELVAALGWPGPEHELSLPIPHDLRHVINGQAEHHVVVRAGTEPVALRDTICSIADRAGAKVRLTIAVPDPVRDDVRDVVGAIKGLVPCAELESGSGSDSDLNLNLNAGSMLPWGWPLRPNTDAVAVAYLLSDIAPGGADGSHSVVQEARALRELGAESRICIFQDSLNRAADLYGNGDRLFAAYADDTAGIEAVGEASIVVATDGRSSALLDRVVGARPDLASAYYVQDYEALFSAPGSQESDRALLSYRAGSGPRLYAKSHWLRNVLAARHNVAVAKIPASLSDVYGGGSRPAPADDRLRVAVMIDPRTPRRRPLATLEALTLIEQALGAQVLTFAFGGPADASRALAAQAGSRAGHLGHLRGEEVARMLLSTDVFLDGSAYQAFGQTGLEAMGCGAVPVLPEFGGTAEYAEDGINASLVPLGTPEELATAVVLLAGDRNRLTRMSDAARRTTGEFSLRTAAATQLALFASLIEARRSTMAS